MLTLQLYQLNLNGLESRKQNTRGQICDKTAAAKVEFLPDLHRMAPLNKSWVLAETRRVKGQA